MKKIYSGVIEFFNDFYNIWITERPSQQAAALAYYSMFSFAPVIYVAYTVAGLFIRNSNVTDSIYRLIEDVLGSETAQFIYDSVSNLSESTQSSSLLLSLIGFLALVFAASGLFYQLQFALNKIWGVPLPEKGQTGTLIRQRLFAFFLVISLGLFLVLLTFLSVLLSLLDQWILPNYSLQIGTYLMFFVVIAVVFLLLYKILPQTRIAWRDIWLGALLSALLLMIGGYLVGLYLGSSRANSALEAAGSFAVLLVGFYYFAQVFLLGSVFSRVYAHRFGSRRQIQTMGDLEQD